MSSKFYEHTQTWLDDTSQRTHVLNRAIESVVGSWSLASGLVHSGGDSGSGGGDVGSAGGEIDGGGAGGESGGTGDGGRTSTGVAGAPGTALGGGV